MYTRCPRCGWKLSDKNFTKEVRESYPRAFSPWKPEEDKQLEELVEQGTKITEMAQALGRQPSAIQRRIAVLNIREAAGCFPLEESDDSLKYIKAADERVNGEDTSAAPAPESPTGPADAR